MHTLGKVLLWLNVLGALGAILLTAKLLDVRNSWVKEIEQKQEQVERNAEQLATLRADYRRLRSELGDTLFGWDRSWPPIRADRVRMDQQGQLHVQGLGISAGFYTPGADPNNPMPEQMPIVHAFQVTPDGSRFVGTFQAIDVQPDSSTLAPIWHVEPEDFAHLQPDAAWRFRSEVPASKTTEFSRLRTLRSSAMRDLENQQFYLQDITEQETAAGELLTARREQLEGNGDAPGLVAELTATGDARDAEALRLDALRRQLKAKQDRIGALRAEVERLEAQLEPHTP